MATLKLPSIHFSRSAYYVRMLSIQFCVFCCCLRLLHVHIQFFFGIQPYPIELFMSERNEEKKSLSVCCPKRSTTSVEWASCRAELKLDFLPKKRVKLVGTSERFCTTLTRCLVHWINAKNVSSSWPQTKKVVDSIAQAHRCCTGSVWDFHVCITDPHMFMDSSRIMLKDISCHSRLNLCGFASILRRIEHVRVPFSSSTGDFVEFSSPCLSIFLNQWSFWAHTRVHLSLVRMDIQPLIPRAESKHEKSLTDSNM